jgi:hypothetical protein
MWNGCSEMRERRRKKRGEILNVDGRERNKNVIFGKAVGQMNHKDSKFTIKM